MVTWWAAVVAAVGVLALAARKPREWTAEEIAAEERWRAARLAERRCPDSGQLLDQRTEATGGVLLTCSICDCLGYWEKDLDGRPAT